MESRGGFIRPQTGVPFVKMNRIRDREGAVALAVTLLIGLTAGDITPGTSNSAGTSGAATSLAVTMPSAAVRDVAIAHVVVKPSSATASAAGWTQIGSSVASTGSAPVGNQLFYRVVDGTEGASITFTLSASSRAAGGITVLPGTDGTTPVDVSGSNTNAASTSSSGSAVTTTKVNDLAIWFYGLEAGSTCSAPTNSATLKYTVASSTGSAGSKVAACAASKAIAAAGGTAATAVTLSASAASVVRTVAFRLPVASFTPASNSGTETSGSVDFQVLLSGAQSHAASIPFTFAGSAIPGASCTGNNDYIPPATANVPAGSTSALVTMTLCNNPANEQDEDVIVSMGAVTHATSSGGTFTMNILNVAPGLTFSVSSSPLLANGNPDTGANWGTWVADPEAVNVDSTNYLGVTHTGGGLGQTFTIDFSVASFAGSTDPAHTIAINSNTQFACWQDTTPGVTAPNEGTYTHGATTGTGSVTLQFTSNGNIWYCAYRLLTFPTFLLDQSYTASFTVT